MIFVTVGASEPFDRLIRIVDAWAGEAGRTDVVAQIGRGTYEPRHFSYKRFLDAKEYREMLEASTVLVAHAGMGTILTAHEAGRRILVFPRRATLGETRNEHQLATARRLLEMGRLEVALDEEELRRRLDSLESMPNPRAVGPFAEPRLTEAIFGFLHEGNRPPRS